AVLFAFCNFLFSYTGSIIIAAFSIIIGILFITEISIGEIASKLYEQVKKFGNLIRKKCGEIKENKGEKKKDEVFQEVAPTAKEAEENQEFLINDFTEVAYKTDEIVSTQDEQNQNQKEVEEDVEFDPELAPNDPENHDYRLPPIDLLIEPEKSNQQYEKSHVQATVRKLERTFQSFGVKAKVTKVNVGPAVTKYEVYPEAGVKVSKIVSLHDDIALALAAKDIRIEAPIPGKSAVGIEVPNKEVAMVSLREVMDDTLSDKSSKL